MKRSVWSVLAAVSLALGVLVAGGVSAAAEPEQQPTDTGRVWVSIVPARVGTGVDWARASAGAYHTCGVRTDRSLWCWGSNYNGQLGLGDQTDRLVPARVGAGVDWADVSAGDRHTCGVRTDRSLWCWGFNRYGQLGLGDTKSRRVPARV